MNVFLVLFLENCVSKGREERKISRNWKKRYEINRRCLDDEEVEINLDPNLLILSTR